MMMNEMKMILWMMMVKAVISLTMMNDPNNQYHIMIGSIYFIVANIAIKY